jgi:hypothetical protein
MHGLDIHTFLSFRLRLPDKLILCIMHQHTKSWISLLSMKYISESSSSVEVFFFLFFGGLIQYIDRYTWKRSPEDSQHSKKD